jgi:hypothetical protein
MLRRRVWLALPLGFAVFGCLPQGGDTPLVPSNPFVNDPAPPPAQSSCAPATAEAATRVALVGQKLVAANPQVGLHPLFRTIGAASPEVFHRGTDEVLITEGLVKQCTEGQLAAVLAQEMGKMASEREAQDAAKAGAPEREPPPALFIGADATSSRGPADLTYQAELAPYERDRKRRFSSAPQPAGDSDALGRSLLLKAGYADTDLQAARPLLKVASENMALEKQLAAPAASQPATR